MVRTFNPNRLNKTYSFDGKRQTARFKQIKLNENSYIFIYDCKVGKEYGRLELFGGIISEYNDELKRYYEMIIEDDDYFLEQLNREYNLGHIEEITKKDYDSYPIFTYTNEVRNNSKFIQNYHNKLWKQ